MLSTPVIGSLKLLYPDAELWVLTTPLGSQLIQHDPRLSGVIAFDKRGNDRGVLGLTSMADRLRLMKFDKVYSLHKSFRTALLLWLAQIPERIGFRESKGWFFYHKRPKRTGPDHDVLRNLRILSEEAELEDLTTTIEVFPANSQQQSIELQELRSTIDRYALIVPGSVWKTKRWKWQGFREVTESLLAAGYEVILLGSESEREVCKLVGEGLALYNLGWKSFIG